MPIDNKIEKPEEQDHRSLAISASGCAKHGLPYFEKIYPDDSRPDQAIEIDHDTAGVERNWQLQNLPQDIRSFVVPSGHIRSTVSREK
ncbi:MAG TPA: hypothetical protein VMC09_05965 [Anaerolineales bacterium]|nr:hypothetical protein [Anaerolineales bacterium]